MPRTNANKVGANSSAKRSSDVPRELPSCPDAQKSLDAPQERSSPAAHGAVVLASDEGGKHDVWA